MLLAILFSISFMCSFQVECWSNKTLRNLIDSSICISWLLIISFDRQTRVLSVLLGLWKNQYFIFSIFKESLFAVNQSSLITTVKKCLMSLWLKKRLVSSTNIIPPNKQDAFGRLLTYSKNRSGLRIDPWGTPQVTYLRSVLLFSPVSCTTFY